MPAKRWCVSGRSQVVLPLHLHAPSLARSHMQQAGGWPEAVMDYAVLVTSELVSNAVQHAGGELVLVVLAGSGKVRTEVHDQGDPIEPTLFAAGGVGQDARRAAVTDQRGRGLLIVAAVADRWGTTEQEPTPGKSVWFELDLLPAPGTLDRGIPRGA